MQQRIAASIIPNLVPLTLKSGKVADEKGRIFNCSVNELIYGEILEEAWEQMNAEEQSSVVVELVEALEKLHSIWPSDEKVKDVLQETLGDQNNQNLDRFQKPGIFGGPNTGFLSDGSALLTAIMDRRRLKKTFCTMEPVIDSQDIQIRSEYSDLGSLLIFYSDMSKWPLETVFCHKVLTPGKIILHSSITPDGKSKYKLASITGWELAGFYPPSYELSLQDTYLGTSNRHLSFYLLLKEQMKNIVPRTESQIPLLNGMELVYESQQKCLLEDGNVLARIRKRFLEDLGLVTDEDPFVGWVRSEEEEGGLIGYDGDAYEKMVEDVVEEMREKRRENAT